MMMHILTIFMMVVAYCIGSISSAIIVCRLFGFPDPRTVGSKNAGATNVLRIAGKQYAALVLIGDILKGLIPLLLAHILGLSFTEQGYVCLAAVLGHIYPLFFNFAGGKGVATALGAFVGLNPTLGTIAIVLWLLIASITRFSSLASLITMAIVPVYVLFTVQHLSSVMPLVLITAVIFYKHRTNIARLMNGMEPKFKLG